MGIGKALSKGMGLLPAIASGAMGEKNKGFALGILPGMLYKQNAKKDEAEERARMEAEAEAEAQPQPLVGRSMKKGGAVKKASSASKRGDGIAQRGKTKGRMV
jgi:hypothetical protein